MGDQNHTELSEPAPRINHHRTKGKTTRDILYKQSKLIIDLLDIFKKPNYKEFFQFMHYFDNITNCWGVKRMVEMIHEKKIYF